MSNYLDIATSLHTNSLTLFVGSGFSKFMTDGNAPSWLELLAECTKLIDRNNKLSNQLFDKDEDGEVIKAKYDLTVCAQIIEGEFIKKEKSIKEAIAKIIKKKINSRTINKSKLDALQTFFNAHPNINIITTNYDTLFSDHIIPLTSRIIIEGSTIPRINSGQNIYHIHGCVNRPSSLVLTINDYYNFQNTNNYFSRKFFTLLQETTVVILGYSLGDFNLNSILNEVKNSKQESFRKTDIYYITKDNVVELIETFYSMTYGIRVIQKTEIIEFLNEVEEEYDAAIKLIDSIEDLKKVIKGEIEYPLDFLKLRVSLSMIMLQAASIGIESKDKSFIAVLMYVLQKKREFTGATGAWLQYEHLADWLIEIASVITIKNTDYEEEFCELAAYSFKKCSRVQYRGYSWHAWSEWNTRWTEMKIENQKMLEDLIRDGRWDKDLDIDKIYIKSGGDEF